MTMTDTPVVGATVHCCECGALGRYVADTGASDDQATPGYITDLEFSDECKALTPHSALTGQHRWFQGPNPSARHTRWFDPVSPGAVLDVEYVVRAIALARSASELGARIDVAYIAPGTLDDVVSLSDVTVETLNTYINQALCKTPEGENLIDFTRVVSLRFSARSILEPAPARSGDDND